MDLSLELNLNVEVELQSQTELLVLLRLLVSTTLLLSTASQATESLASGVADLVNGLSGSILDHVASTVHEFAARVSLAANS